MKTLFFLPLLASAFLLAGCHTPCATTASAPAPAPAAPTVAVTVNLTGDWNWTCCDNQYHGTLTLQQDAGKLTGKLFDGDDTTGGGAVEGTVIGNKVAFARTWGEDSRQDYTLTVSNDGNKLEGELDGTRDEAVGTHFEATRK